MKQLTIALQKPLSKMNNVKPAHSRLILFILFLSVSVSLFPEMLNTNDISTISMYFKKEISDTLGNSIGYLFGKYAYSPDSTVCYVNTETDAYIYRYADNQIIEYRNGKKLKSERAISLPSEFDLLLQINPFIAFADSAVISDGIAYVKTPFSLIKDSILFFFNDAQLLDSVNIYKTGSRIMKTEYSDYRGNIPALIKTYDYKRNILESIFLNKIIKTNIDKNSI